MNDLKHFGVLGMHWGQRRSRPKTKTSLHKRMGKNVLVKKDEFGNVLSKKVATKEQAAAFAAKQKKRKLSELQNTQRKRANIKRVANAVATVYAVYTVAQLLSPGGINPRNVPRWVGNVAWTTGRVVSNSPLR